MSISNKVLWALGTLILAVLVGVGYLIVENVYLNKKIINLEGRVLVVENNQHYSLKLHEASSRESNKTLDLIGLLISTLEESGVLAKSGEGLLPVVVWKRNPKYTGIGPVSKIKKGSRIGPRKVKNSSGKRE